MRQVSSGLRTRRGLKIGRMTGAHCEAFLEAWVSPIYGLGDGQLHRAVRGFCPTGCRRDECDEYGPSQRCSEMPSTRMGTDHAEMIVQENNNKYHGKPRLVVVVRASTLPCPE